jgi:TonB family protein
MLLSRQTLLIAAISSLPAAPCLPQSIQGVIVSQSTHRPIGGARVALVDDSGHVVARYTTDSVSGAFYLNAPKRGSYEVQILVGHGGLSFSPFYALENNQTIDGAFAAPDYAQAFLDAFLPDDVTKVATYEPRVDTVLQYPDEMLRAGRNGIVRVHFIVDRDGRADTSTAQVVEADDSSFARSVVKALPRIHFRAAERGGHAVAQVLDMAFDFCMRGAPLRLKGPGVITVRAP